MSKTVSSGRKVWNAPAVRNVVPARRTRGGVGNLVIQDDLFYNNS